jgi:hypothetical protein
MTPQEIFDTVVQHLRKQGSKSLLTEQQCRDLMEPPGACAYRGENGKKCAAGILISDEEYLPEMEGYNFNGLLQEVIRGKTAPPSLGQRLSPHWDLIRALQHIHDRSEIRDWEDDFRQIALNHKLIYTPPT